MSAIIYYGTNQLVLPRISRLVPRMNQDRFDNYSTSRKHEALFYDEWMEWNIISRGLTLAEYYKLYNFLSYAGQGATLSIALDADKAVYGVLDGAAAAGQKDIPLTQLIQNYGFENLDGADDFSNYTEFESNGATVEDETSIVHSGSHACKISEGGGGSGWAYIYQDIALQPGTRYNLGFYTRGDGTHAGNYQIYDLSNSANIVALKSTNITGTTFTFVYETFTAPAGCSSVRIYLAGNIGTGSIVYFDTVYVFPVYTIGDYYLIKQLSGDNFEIVKINSYVFGISVTVEENLKYSYVSGDVFRHVDFWPAVSLKEKIQDLPMEPGSAYFDFSVTVVEEK